MLKEKYQRWLKSGFFSLFDQIIFSLANFILNIFLTRTLSIESYGLFSIVYSIVFLLNGIQNSLFTEPMMIYGPSKFHKNELGYIYFLQKYILLFAVLASFTCLLFMNLFVEEFNLQYFLYFFMLIPVVLYFWFWRFVFYMQKNIKTAFWGDVIYANLLIFTLVIFYILRNKIIFNLKIAILIITFSALIAIIYYWKLFKKQTETNSRLELQKIAITAQKSVLFKKHYHYGKWLLLSSIMFYIVNRLYTPLLGFKLGFEQAGIYRALENLFFPVVRITTALNLVIVPILAGKQFSQKKLKRIIGLIIIAFASFTLFYSLLIVFYGDQLIMLIYNKQELTKYKYLILMFGMIYTVNSIGHAIINYFKVSEKSNIIFITRTIGVASLIVPAYFFLKDLTLIKATYLYLIGTTASVLYLIYNLYLVKYKNGKNRVSQSI